MWDERALLNRPKRGPANRNAACIIDWQAALLEQVDVIIQAVGRQPEPPGDLAHHARMSGEQFKNLREKGWGLQGLKIAEGRPRLVIENGPKKDQQQKGVESLTAHVNGNQALSEKGAISNP